MTLEMSGLDEKNEGAELSPLKIGEIKSSFGKEEIVIIDPTKSILEISRYNCIPNKEIYIDKVELKNDPVEAARNIQVEKPVKTGDSITNILAEASARVDAAKKNLNLTPKQKEHFDGLIENFWGAIPFLTGKGIRTAATGLLVFQMATGCIPGVIARPIETSGPASSPIAETTVAIVMMTETTTATPTEAPTPTPEPTVI